MSLYSRRTLIVGIAALAGCGFEPVYAPGGEAAGLRGRINVLPPADEEGLALVNRLEERLGLPDQPDLLLSADIRLSEQALGFLPDGTISRYNVTGQVPWSVSREGEVLIDGREESFTGYSATSTTVATSAAQRDARERLMIILADRIVSRILARAREL